MAETKQAQHTPGPWETTYSDDSDNGRYVVGPNRGNNDKLIADCYADTALDLGLPSCEEAQANARLIAACPELLESLKQMCERFTASDPEAIAVRSRALATIKKAEGL